MIAIKLELMKANSMSEKLKLWMFPIIRLCKIWHMTSFKKKLNLVLSFPDITSGHWHSHHNCTGMEWSWCEEKILIYVLIMVVVTIEDQTVEWLPFRWKCCEEIVLFTYKISSWIAHFV